MGLLIPEDIPLDKMPASERRVIRAFQSTLKDSWLIIPRLDLINERRPFEVDVLLINDLQGIVVIEVKGGPLAARRSPLAARRSPFVRESGTGRTRSQTRHHPDGLRTLPTNFGWSWLATMTTSERRCVRTRGGKFLSSDRSGDLT
jgi:hypothetical protein